MKDVGFRSALPDLLAANDECQAARLDPKDPGKEPNIFWSSLRGERVTLLMHHQQTLIQMGDWYSEELIPKLNETTAMVKKSMTA